jgi:hypothetical protein
VSSYGSSRRRLGVAATIMVALLLVAVGMALAAKPKGSYTFTATSSAHHPSVSFVTTSNGRKLQRFNAGLALQCKTTACGGFGGIRSFTRSSVKVSSTGTFKVSGNILAANGKKLGTQTVTGTFVSPTKVKGKVTTHADLGQYKGVTESYTAKGSPAAAAGATRGKALVHAASCPVAGQCGVNSKTHCPTEGPLQPRPPQKCVSIPATLKEIVTHDPNGGSGCVENTYIQVQLQPGMDEYEMVWYSTVGLGTRWWTNGDATVGPGSVTGEGASYKVPKGYAAVSAAGGASASGNCPGSPPEGTHGVAGWGIPACGAGAASAAVHAAAASCCPNPKITGRAVRDTSTGDVSVDLSASRLGKVSKCGRAKMSITDPGHGTLYLRVNQHGSTATAHRDLVGSEQCLDLTRATVSVPKGGTAHRDLQINGSVIRIVRSSSTAQRTPEGAISLTVTANHFLPACGKRDFTWQSPDGIVTLPIVKAKGSTATAKRTLPSGQDCVPDGTIQVVQPRDPWSRAQRQVVAPAPFPAVCRAPAP